MEIGFQQHLGEYYRNFTASYPFDFVIGSTHVVEGRDPYNRVLFETRSDAEVYEKSFVETWENIRIIQDSVIRTRRLSGATESLAERSSQWDLMPISRITSHTSTRMPEGFWRNADSGIIQYL